MPPRKKKESEARYLKVLDATGFDKEALLHLLHADQQPCDCAGKPCKSASKSNPNCLCQLIPAESSFKKKGLWQKDKDLLKGLGDDPSLLDRKVRICAVPFRRHSTMPLAGPPLCAMAALPGSCMPTDNAEGERDSSAASMRLHANAKSCARTPQTCMSLHGRAATREPAPHGVTNKRPVRLLC